MVWNKTRTVPAKVRQKPETLLQQACVTWLTGEQKAGRILRFWHTPNGQKLTLGQAMGLKRLGVQPGIPDLAVRVLASPDRFQDLWFELKSETGRTSEEQRDFIDETNDLGGFARVVRSLDELKGFVNSQRVL